METMRLILVFLHTLIIIFAAVDLHPHLTLNPKTSDYREQISSIIRYITELLRITLFHTSSIVAVWFSLRYGAGMVRASGILLIGELLQIITKVLQHTLKPEHVGNGELSFTMIYDILLLTAVLITFQLAEQISNHEKSLMQVELLADTANDVPSENFVEPTFI